MPADHNCISTLLTDVVLKVELYRMYWWCRQADHQSRKVYNAYTIEQHAHIGKYAEDNGKC